MTIDSTPPVLSAPRRLVVRAPNWLGDAVLALPAMSAIRQAFPEAALTVAAVPAVAPMFLELTGVRPDAVLAIDKSDERKVLAAGGFDTIVLFPNSFRAAWVARQAGIGGRWGYQTGARGWLLTRAIARPGGSLHQADYYRHLVRGLGLDVPDTAPSIRPSAPTVGRADEILRARGADPTRPLVGMAPGAAYGHAKRWPPRRVAEVVQMLSADPGVTCVLVGAAGDRDAGREIESALPPGVEVVDLIGHTDLRALIGVLSRCAAFVSNDSGAMHLAAAAGVPVTAIFGPTNEHATAPIGDHDVLVHPVFCRPCMLRDCPIDHRCMKGISAARVAERVRARLARAE